ncbi:hypothetical protein GHT09_010051 [Marmota monax]|uniref:Uncharacterized protein n=1 Tax=Marmota monax TaxID=9995 RepID=A0A834PN53_MARMO|nr:hypothetical protein GHT09_010051 [Marmota monax]
MLNKHKPCAGPRDQGGPALSCWAGGGVTIRVGGGVLSSGRGDQGLSTLTSLRQVLEDSGMPMDDTQFSQLTTKISFKKEGMSYLDFAAGFQGTKAKPGHPSLLGPPLRC